MGNAASHIPMGIVTVLPAIVAASFILGTAFPNSQPRRAMYAAAALLGVAVLIFVVTISLMR